MLLLSLPLRLSPCLCLLRVFFILGLINLIYAMVFFSMKKKKKLKWGFVSGKVVAMNPANCEGRKRVFFRPSPTTRKFNRFVSHKNNCIAQLIDLFLPHTTDIVDSNNCLIRADGQSNSIDWRLGD